MEHGPTSLLATRRVFATLALVCAGGIGLVAWLGRDHASAPPAAFALGVMAVLAAVVAQSWRDRPNPRRSALQGAALIAMSALTAPVGWVFGLNSSFAAVITLVLVTAGLLGETTNRRQVIGGAVVCATTMLGQATMTALVLAGVVPDDSLQVLQPRGHPLWHHVISHASIQAIYLGAFLLGRVFRRRYASVATALDHAVQLAARRDAQVEEARTAYQRALAVTQRGIFTGATLGAVRLGGLVDRAEQGEVYSATDTRDGTTGTVRVTRGAPLGAVVLEPGPAPDDGVDLARMIETTGFLDRAALIDFVQGSARALANDETALSPSRVVSTSSRGWRVAARARGDATRFTPPEVIAGGAATRAATVYGLAACTYYALTGTEPFAEVSPADHDAIADRAPLDPRLLADVGEDVARVLQIGLAKAPADRFADVSEFAANLVAALDDNLDAAMRTRAAALPRWSSTRPLVSRESTDRIDVVRSVLDPSPALPTPPPIASTALAQDEYRRSTAWQLALREKLQGQRYGVLALCAAGGLMLAVIAREREAWWAAELGIAGIVLALLVVRDVAASWLWPVIAALSIGPAFAFGLHSGFAAVIALVMFAGGAFRPPTETTVWHRHGATLLAVLVLQATVYAAIAVGWIRDAGNTPTQYPNHPPGTGAVTQTLVLATFAIAFFLSRTIDARFARLVRRNELIARTAAHQEVLLANARADLDRATSGDSGGLFTGSQLGGYTVGTLLGRGGMGEVYEARRADERVALKLIRADRVSNPESLRLFSREASTLQRVRSPYVARVVDVGTDAGVPFMAMELVAGSSLADLLRAHERLGEAALARMIHDVARGLEDIHRAGVLHLDIKPSNLVLTDDGWKVIDFGIAELADPGGRRATNVIMGTPAYMAPELIDGETIDPRSDLFSLCAVIYRALTGRPAWTATTALAGRTPPLDPYRLTTAPVDVTFALRIGLATAPEDRFATAAELGTAFDAAFASRLDPVLRRRARQLLLRLPWS